MASKLKYPTFIGKAREEAVIAAQAFLQRGGWNARLVIVPECPWGRFTPEAREWQRTFEEIAPEPESC